MAIDPSKLTPEIAITWVLMASYAYYHIGTTIMVDEEYDALYKWLHPRLHEVDPIWKNRVDLIPKETGGTSLFMITEDEYPTLIKMQCHHFISTRANTSTYLSTDNLLLNDLEETPLGKFL